MTFDHPTSRPTSACSNAANAAWSQIVGEVAARFGTPVYIYRPALIEKRIGEITGAFPAPFAISFAVKSNPNPWLLSWLRGRIGAVDVSSGGEVALALRCGWPADKITFTGPAKTEAEIEAAVKTNVGGLVVESLDEAHEVDRIAGACGHHQRILIRIAPAEAEPGFAVRIAGRPSQFGIDEAELSAAIATINGCANLMLDGFHAYTGAQCQEDEAIAAHFRTLWRLFREAVHLAEHPISELIFGGGMGIPYHDGDVALDIPRLQPVMREIVDEIAAEPGLEAPKLKLEIGRYLVGESGLYVTRVVRTKVSMGSDIVLCDGGLNHNLGACGHLGGIAHRHYRMLPVRAHEPAVEKTYRIVGPLCTTIDTLAHRVTMGELHAGDLIGVHCSGAYGPSASPLNFISYEPPKEIAVLEEDGGHKFEDITWMKSPFAAT
ncbi:MAG: type III PLP-dependent enzyme [Alphaproteobacteria bacterium]|nr:type III PLP-dependent enzyme [Alphaproteobacteria bacterium]